MPKRILLTGASGCIGHYIAEALIRHTDHDLYLLVRNPAKLKVDLKVRPGITVLQGDMQNIEAFADLLGTINGAILTATAWGDPKETYDINVVKTLGLMNLLNPEVCEQVIYFSTASILDHENQLLPEAGSIGTDYIRTKYQCYQKLGELAIAPKITTVYPTLVMGGDGTKPYSHLSAGLKDVVKWISVARFLQADGSFHFVHAYDIAQVVVHLLENPPTPEQPRKYVLANAPLTVNQAIREICTYLGKRIYFQILLSMPLADFIIKTFKIQMAEWDRFCLNYRHFTYKQPISPATFGLTSYCPTLSDLLRISGIPGKAKTP